MEVTEAIDNHIVYGCMLEQDFIEDLIKLCHERKTNFKISYPERLNRLKSAHDGQSPEYKAFQRELSGDKVQNVDKTACRPVQNQVVKKKKKRRHEDDLRKKVLLKQARDADVSKLQKDNAELTRQSSFLEEEKKCMQAKIQQLEEQCFNLRKENKDLKSKVREDAQVAQDMDDMNGLNGLILNLQRLQNENIVEQLEMDVAQLEGHKCVLKGEVEHTNLKLIQETSFKDRCAQLEDEKKRIQKENEALQDEVMKLCTEIDLNNSMKQLCVQLEAERDCMFADLKVLREKVTEARYQIESEGSYEHCLARKKQLENGIANLRSHTYILNDQLTNLTSKLQEQAPLKEQCDKLEAEINRSQKENECIQDNITSVLHEMAEETSQKQKFQEMKVLKEGMMIKKKELMGYWEKLVDEHDALRIHVPRYEEMVINVENLKKHNVNLQNEIDDLKGDIRKRSAARDSYLQIKNKTVDVEAKNAELQKKKQRLEKKLLQLTNVQKTHEQTNEDMDGLRQENRLLHETIYSLNEQITSNKVLNAQVKTLKMEMKPLQQINSSLSKKIEALQKKRQEQQDLQDTIEEIRRQIAEQQQENMKLHGQFKAEVSKLFAKGVRFGVVNMWGAELG